MTIMDIVLAVTGPPLPAKALLELAELVDEVRQLPGDLDTEQLLDALDGVTIYALGGSEYLGHKFFSRVPSTLRHICFLGTAHAAFVDVAAQVSSGVGLSRTPFANTRSTAEFALTLALSALRDLPHFIAEAGRGNWAAAPRRSLYGATVGVVGFGHVGAEFTRLVRAFDTWTLVWNRTARDEAIIAAGATPASLNDILTSSDVVSVHLEWPTAQTGHLLGAAEFALAKPELVLVNTARSAAVDPAALGDFLDGHPDARALFDGYYAEPAEPAADRWDLLRRQNFLLTPHTGYLTTDSNNAMAAMLVANVRAVLRGETAPHAVAPAR